jgi:hypothetical protein
LEKPATAIRSASSSSPCASASPAADDAGNLARDAARDHPNGQADDPTAVRVVRVIAAWRASAIRTAARWISAFRLNDFCSTNTPGQVAAASGRKQFRRRHRTVDEAHIDVLTLATGHRRIADRLGIEGYGAVPL